MNNETPNIKSCPNCGCFHDPIFTPCSGDELPQTSNETLTTRTECYLEDFVPQLHGAGTIEEYVSCKKCCNHYDQHKPRPTMNNETPTPRTFRFTTDAGSKLLYYGDEFVAKINAKHSALLSAMLKLEKSPTSSAATPITDEARLSCAERIMAGFKGSTITELVPAETARTLERDLTAAQSRIKLLQENLVAPDDDSTVGSCDCGIKSWEIQYHRKGCRYRLIEERNTAQSSISELEKELESEKDLCNDIEREKASVCEQIAALQKDKERLDWLSETNNKVSFNNRIGKYIVQNNMQVVGNIGTGRTIREAIDAAMHPTPAPPSPEPLPESVETIKQFARKLETYRNNLLEENKNLKSSLAEEEVAHACTTKERDDALKEGKRLELCLVGVKSQRDDEELTHKNHIKLRNKMEDDFCEELEIILDQLESCNFECIAGELKNHTGFIELKQMLSRNRKEGDAICATPTVTSSEGSPSNAAPTSNPESAAEFLVWHTEFIRCHHGIHPTNLMSFTAGRNAAIASQTVGVDKYRREIDELLQQIK